MARPRSSRSWVAEDPQHRCCGANATRCRHRGRSARLIDVALAAGGDLAKLAESDDRHQLFAEFLAACSVDGPPTVVVLEDLHWADAATLDFLAFAGRAHGAHAVCSS